MSSWFAFDSHDVVKGAGVRGVKDALLSCQTCFHRKVDEIPLTPRRAHYPVTSLSRLDKMLVMSDYVIHVVHCAKHGKIYLPDSKYRRNNTRSLNAGYVTSSICVV